MEGDVEAALRLLDASSFDGCFCDPPYHLTEATRGGSSRKGGFMGQAWDGGDVAFRDETWAAVSRVLKPGAHLLAFGGTRTWHRLACAIEDAGFEIRDCLMWIHGQGFPKSLDISKAIDRAAGSERRIARIRTEHNICRPKGGGNERLMTSAGKRETRTVADTLPATREAKRFSGYGTALKPAWEPIILAMKPCDGTFTENALKWGVAGIGIDSCRVTSHRWPANVLLDEQTAGLLDEQAGELKSGANPTRRSASKFQEIFGRFKGQAQCVAQRGEDRGGASRFFYVAKASRSERGQGNNHPTVKPLKLCEYLARLILPPSPCAKLLVPFAGSGSEMIGALKAGWEECVGIESDPAYCEIARGRLASLGKAESAEVLP